MKQSTIKDFINGKVSYDKNVQFFWIHQSNGGVQMLADMRGWGRIQNMFKGSDGKIDVDLAEKFQDEVAEFIAQAINEKIERDYPAMWTEKKSNNK